MVGGSCHMHRVMWAVGVEERVPVRVHMEGRRPQSRRTLGGPAALVRARGKQRPDRHQQRVSLLDSNDSIV